MSASLLMFASLWNVVAFHLSVLFHYSTSHLSAYVQHKLTYLCKQTVLKSYLIYATADEAGGGSIYVSQMFFSVFFVFCFFSAFSVRQKYETTVLWNG